MSRAFASRAFAGRAFVARAWHGASIDIVAPTVLFTFYVLPEADLAFYVMGELDLTFYVEDRTMIHGAIHVGDVGTLLKCTFKKPDETVFDISTATTKEINFERPDGTSFVKAGAFFTNGADGLLTYHLAAGDIAAAGKWYFQGHVILAGGAELHSDRVVVVVRPNNTTPS